MKRPVSITIIALWLFLGALLDFRIVAFEPVRLHFITILGVHLHRYAALSAYLLLISIATFIGVGLIDLRPSARVAGIVFCIFLMLNAVIRFLLPLSFERFVVWAERSDPSGILTPSALHKLHAFSLAIQICIPAIVVYFLWARRSAFRNACAPPAPDSSSSASSSAQEVAP